MNQVSTRAVRISADQLYFYQAGIRVQQLIILHDFAFGWRSDKSRFSEQTFDSAIDRMWGVLADLSPKLPSRKGGAGELLNNAVESWETRKSRGTPWFRSEDSSEVMPALQNLKEFLGVRATHAPFETPTTRIWYELGLEIVDGKQATNGWKWTHASELNRLLNVLRLRREDVFPRSRMRVQSDSLVASYPACLKGWSRVETGLAQLREILTSRRAVDSDSEERPAKRRFVVDPSVDARDKFIHGEVLKGTPYKEIKTKLTNESRSWPVIDSIQGIRSAAQLYAKRNNLRPIPSRQKRKN